MFGSLGMENLADQMYGVTVAAIIAAAVFEYKLMPAESHQLAEGYDITFN